MSPAIHLKELGFRDAWSAESLPEGGFFARVARVEKARGWFWSEEGDCVLDLNLLAESHDVAVGDWFILRRDGAEVLPVRRLERFSLISRRASGERADEQLIAANIDTLFIVTSCNQDFSAERLERYLALALEAGVRPVVLLTKADRCEDIAPFREQAAALWSGLDVIALNALNEEQVSVLARWCGPGQTVAMVGSSGVGKSTLTNQLLGERVQLTQEARDEDAKGRHTTTSRNMHRMRDGGMIIDTPGMREVQLPACEGGLNALFSDVTDWLGRCRFNDCQHGTEPGCAIREAIQTGALAERRWLSYKTLLDEQQKNEQSMAERREAANKLTRRYRQYQKQARGNKGRRE